MQKSKVSTISKKKAKGTASIIGDIILTVLLVGQLYFCAFHLFDEATLIEFGYYCLGAAILVSTLKFVSYYFALTVLKYTGKSRLNDSTAASRALNASKFAEQAWQLTVHAAGSYYAYGILMEEDFAWLDVPYAVDKIYVNGIDPYPENIRRFIMAELSVWFWTGISCRFLEERRKDYFVMLSHHVITIFAVMQCWYTGCIRYSVAVLYLHDTSDVVIDTMKMLNYLEIEGAKYFFITEITFLANFISWAYFRFYKFFFLWKALLLGNSAQRWLEQGMPNALFAGKVGGVWLLVLQVMHYWWFYLLARMLKKLLSKEKKTNHEIAREGYEGDSDKESHQD